MKDFGGFWGILGNFEGFSRVLNGFGGFEQDFIGVYESEKRLGSCQAARPNAPKPNVLYAAFPKILDIDIRRVLSKIKKL